MKISYAIPVWNELEEIQNITKYILENRREGDELVIVVDEENATQEVRDFVETLAEECIDDNVVRHYHPLKKDFAKHKNFLSSKCTGDWIFQLDADEYPHEYLMTAIPWVIENNPEVEAFWLARINTVSGIKQEHIDKWRWQVNDKGWINFPDYQMRLYKNDPERIKWTKPVHEQLVGFSKFGHMPANEGYCIIHPKSIGRQEQQNEFYDKI